VPKWLLGFIDGVVATLIGFSLTVLWDMYKARRDTQARDYAVLAAVKEEILTHIAIVQKNQAVIQ
jgi:hypothetical protein